LRVVLGLPQEVCRLILQAREEKGFANVQDLVLRVPEVSPFLPEISRLILFGAVNPYYTIEARGKGEGGGSVRGIRVTVKVDPREKEGYKIVQWLDFLM